MLIISVLRLIISFFLRYYNGIIKIDGAKVRRCRQKKSSYWLYAPNQKVSIEDYEEETQL